MQAWRRSPVGITGAGCYNAFVSSAAHIAVFLPNPVGDAIMATPALRALRRHFASSRITHVGRQDALDVLAGAQLANAAVVERSARRPKLRNFLATVRRLRQDRFDFGVLLPNSLRSALLARLGGIRSLAGYDRDGRGLLLTTKLPVPRDEAGRRVPVPTIDYYARLAEALGARCASRRMELAVAEADAAAADRLLAEGGRRPDRPLVMLNPGASFGPSKLWPAERYAAVGDALAARRGAEVIVNASPAERAVARAVGGSMRTAPLVNMADAAGTIGLLKALVSRCDLLITNDTGARHFGAAFGVAVVTIFGSTDPVWAQIDYEHETILRAEVACSPCQRKVCPNPPGPTRQQCMKAITAEMVLAAAEALLDRRAAGGDGPARAGGARP